MRSGVIVPRGMNGSKTFDESFQRFACSSTTSSDDESFFSQTITYQINHEINEKDCARANTCIDTAAMTWFNDVGFFKQHRYGLHTRTDAHTCTHMHVKHPREGDSRSCDTP